MTGETIKTLAEYIAKLHGTGRTLEHPELYQDHAVDTNGTQQDYVGLASERVNVSTK
jgi:Ser/Thr protein kinase RdoA (MazF antagonist)